MKTIALIAILFLAGCQTFQTHTQKIEVSCAGFSATLRILAAANEAGKLTESQQEAVGQAIATTMPVCGVDEPPTPDQLKEEAFRQAMLLLQAQVAKLETSP